MNRAEIGRVLRALRKMRGLTQEELARRVTLSRASIVNIEQGRQTLTLDRLHEITSALGFNVKLRIVPAARQDE